MERYGNVKDEWAIIGTADETLTKACGGGRSTARWLESLWRMAYTYTWPGDTNIK